MIKDIKDLEKLLKVCRRQGIDHLKIEGIEIKFGDLPAKGDSRTDQDEEIPTDEPTPEQLMFYAVQGGQ